MVSECGSPRRSGLLEQAGFKIARVTRLKSGSSNARRNPPHGTETYGP